MATNVGELEATLRLRDELSARLKEVDAALAKSGQSFEGVGAKARGFGTVTDGLVGTLTKVGAAFGLAFGAQAFARAITDVVKLGDEIQDLSALTGIGVVELQKLGAVADANGSSMAELSKGVQAMARNIVGDDKSAAMAVKLLGLNLEELKAMKPDEIFLAVADAAAKIDNPMERNRILFDLGGKSLEKLGATVANVSQEMEHVAGVIDEKTITALADADDKIKAFGRTWDAFLAKIGTPALGAGLAGLQALIDKFLELDRVRLQAAKGDPGAAFSSPLAAGEAAGAGVAAAWRDLVRQWKEAKSPLEFLNNLLDAHAPKLKSAAAATDGLADANQKLVPTLKETSDGFDRARLTIDAYRQDAVFPLTDAHKNLIIQLDDIGVSLSEVATLVKAPEVAVRLYLASLKDAEAAHTAFGTSSDALAATLEKLDVTFKKLQTDANLATLMQTNQAALDRFMHTIPDLGIAFLAPDQAGQVDLVAEAFTRLEATIADAQLEQTLFGTSAEQLAAKSAAAWAQYTAEVQAIQSGLAAATRATDGMTASTARLNQQFAAVAGRPGVVQVPNTYQGSYRLPSQDPSSPFYAGSGGGIRPSAMAAAPAVMAPVTVNAQNSLFLPSNQQQLGAIISQAVIAQLKAQGVKVGSA